MTNSPSKQKSMTNSPSKGTALITGASRGIGAVYVDRLAKRGYDLILVARSEARLKALSARLTSETGRSVTPLPADLNDKADLAKVETTLRDDQTITMLVNNAGVASVAPLLNADVEKMDDMIALNITALTRLAYAAAPAFVARGAGVLNNLSSVLALAPERFNASYSATKAYILNFSLTLHQELSPSGVQVQVVLPGATRTAIWARAGIEVASLPASSLMEVDEMVDAALVGLDRRELVTIPSLPDIADWEAYTAARLHLGPNLSRNHAADRYKTVDSTRPSRAM
jgi:short-subunit dehydrogenase